MKKIIIAAVAAAAVAGLLISRRHKKSAGATNDPLHKRLGNETKHLTNVFSRAKKSLVQDVVNEND